MLIKHWKCNCLYDPSIPEWRDHASFRRFVGPRFSFVLLCLGRLTSNFNFSFFFFFIHVDSPQLYMWIYTIPGNGKRSVSSRRKRINFQSDLWLVVCEISIWRLPVKNSYPNNLPNSFVIFPIRGTSLIHEIQQIYPTYPIVPLSSLTLAVTGS